MNLLEHYIKEIHSVTDVTKEYINYTNDDPLEPLFEIDMTVDCYGNISRTKTRFWEKEWETIKKRGYYFA